MNRPDLKKVINKLWPDAQAYTLTANIVGSGTVDPDPTGNTYSGVVQLTAIPRSGWKFIEWSARARWDKGRVDTPEIIIFTTKY